MSEHNEIRALLALAAAGALDAEEQRRMDEHLRGCDDCRRELAGWREIAAGLTSLPMPDVPATLSWQTRTRVASEHAARIARRRHRLLLALLICFAWLLTLVTLALASYFGDELAAMFRLSFTQFEIGFLAYTLFGGVTTFAFTALVGKRRQHERRLI